MFPAPDATVPTDKAEVSVPCTAVCAVEVPNIKLVALSVVKTPLFGEVEPIIPGTSQVKPSNWLTFRLATRSFEATTNGGVEPVGATVEVITPENVPVVALKPPAKFGVPENVGDPLKTST